MSTVIRSAFDSQSAIECVAPRVGQAIMVQDRGETFVLRIIEVYEDKQLVDVTAKDLKGILVSEACMTFEAWKSMRARWSG